MRLNQKSKARPLTASAAGHIMGEIRKLEGRGALKKQGGRVFTLCPFHNERTPSLILTTSIGSKHEIGSWTCFGCGEHGSWNKLAEALGLELVGEDTAVAKQVQKYDVEFYDKLLKERFKSFGSILVDLDIEQPCQIEDDFVWRTLPGSFLSKVGACKVKGTKNGLDYLFLPNYINEELVGGVRAVMVDTGDKTVVKYKNSNGEWSRTKGLYPYDFAASAMAKFEKEHGFRGLMLVEGARDSLAFNCEGMPTLGLLGTQSWSQGKLDWILDLDPDWVGVCMDGDKSGRAAEEKVWADIKRLVPARKMNLTRFNKECDKEVDPGNAPPEVIDSLWSTMMKRRIST